MGKYFSKRFSVTVQGASLVMTHAMCQAVAAEVRNLAGGAEYRLVFLQQGSARCVQTQMHAGDCLLLQPGQTVQCRFSVPGTIWGIGFRGEDAQRLYEMVSGQHLAAVITHSAPQQVAEQIETAASIPESAAGDLRRTGILYELLSGLVSEPDVSEQTASHGKRALEYIRKNYTLPISVADVANAIGVSRSWLYRCFMEYAEQTPAMYLRFLRMERAKSLLRRTSMSIQEIAYSVGFEDALYFSRVFSDYAGCSPSAYRNQSDV